MRTPLFCGIAAVAFLSWSAPAAAQGQAFGIGGRLSMVRGDVDTDTSAERFTGGQIRAGLSPRTALEVSLDLRTETNTASTQRVREYPIQASLLLFPVRSVLAPYVLGGGGWYSQKFETLANRETVASETVREFGWHAGFGGELKLGRHAGAHADYRYTFLDFGDDEENAPASPSDNGGFPFLPSHRGSMWTAGLTFYF